MSSILTTKVLLFLVSEHKLDSLHNVFSLSDVQRKVPLKPILCGLLSNVSLFPKIV